MTTSTHPVIPDDEKPRSNSGRTGITPRYPYDAAGNRLTKTAVQEASPNPVSVLSQYSYDPIYELTQAVVNSSIAEGYTYDAVGNWLTSAGPISYNYNTSNELTSTSVAAYAYDNNGNTTSKTTSAGTTNFTWDFENRLASVTLPGTGGTVNFKYDPFGRRIEKIAPTSGTTVYAYDGANATEELGAGGNLLAHYTQGTGFDEPLAMTGIAGAYFYHADGLGSITSMTDSTGNVAASYVYDSFGKLTASTGTIMNPFQYSGREYDPETGLYYYRARYFDPAMGRFISEDPIGYHGGINFYGYVGNDPANFVDPTGYAASGPCLNVDNFVQWLDAHAHKTSQHHCARAVRMGLEAGGLNTTGRPELAKDYGPFLEGNDFSEVSSNDFGALFNPYSPEKGDIVVIQPGPSPAGHIEAWDGSTWVSDFTQNPNHISPYAGPTPSYSIYRSANLCPTSIVDEFFSQFKVRLVNSWF